jgi:hypothetical protein
MNANSIGGNSRNSRQKTESVKLQAFAEKKSSAIRLGKIKKAGQLFASSLYSIS